jgi:hypothetical protein
MIKGVELMLPIYKPYNDGVPMSLLSDILRYWHGPGGG